MQHPDTELLLGGRRAAVRTVRGYLFVHSYLISEMLNHALRDFYKVLILFRKSQGGRHPDFSWRNKCNLEQRCLILDVIPEPE